MIVRDALSPENGVCLIASIVGVICLFDAAIDPFLVDDVQCKGFIPLDDVFACVKVKQA